MSGTQRRNERLRSAPLRPAVVYPLDRGVLRAATVARTKGHEPQGLRHWALAVQGRSNHNKAACALANKMARICYAALRDKVACEPEQPLTKKMSRQAFAMPA